MNVMSDAQWFFGRDGSQGGPVTETVMRQMLASGQLRGTDLAWRDGMAAWQPVAEIAELAGPIPPAGTAPLRPPPLPPAGGGGVPYAQAVPVGYSGPQWGQPGQMPPPQDIGQNAGMRMILPVGRSGWAIASGYLGLLSLFPIIGALFGIGAVITGLLAIADMRKNPQRHGMGRAIFGLIAGALGIIGWGIGLFVLLASRAH